MDMQEIKAAVLDHIEEMVKTDPEAAEAGQAFWAAFGQVHSALHETGQGALAGALELQFTAYTSALVQAAFQAGRKIDIGALLLDGASTN